MNVSCYRATISDRSGELIDGMYRLPGREPFWYLTLTIDTAQFNVHIIKPTAQQRYYWPCYQVTIWLQGGKNHIGRGVWNSAVVYEVSHALDIVDQIAANPERWVRRHPKLMRALIERKFGRGMTSYE